MNTRLRTGAQKGYLYIMAEAYIGFKGRNNSSSMLVNALSQKHYLLTNSFDGLKKDIDMLPAEYDVVYFFGVDKNLTNTFRIEQCSEKDGTHLTSNLDLKTISDRFSAAGIKSTISKTPTHYLCNEAYWHLLKKYQGRAVLIHIPTIKNFNEIFEKITISKGTNKDWGMEKEYLHSTRNNLWNNDYFEFLVKSVWKIDHPVRIIDFGCGYGYLAQMMLPLVPKGSTYKGIDISEELIAEAQNLFSDCSAQISFEVTDLNDYEPAAEYDIVICQAVLRHLNNPEDILKKMIGSVKENGLVICIEPSRRLENAGIFADNEAYDPFENDEFLKQKWLYEEKSGGRDYQIGMRIPVIMEKLGLKGIGVRINDYVDFISAGSEDLESEKRRFTKDHGMDDKYLESENFIAARCHVISFGYK